MNYLLGTNILVHFIRKDEVSRRIDIDFSAFDPANRVIVSIVSFGEIKSIARQNGWGANKLKLLDQLLLTVLRADLTLDIVERYAEIDAYSQGIHPNLPARFTARNMGKNDLWIAATTSILGATLLTTDADFEHLNGIFLSVTKVNLPAPGI